MANTILINLPCECCDKKSIDDTSVHLLGFRKNDNQPYMQCTECQDASEIDMRSYVLHLFGALGIEEKGTFRDAVFGLLAEWIWYRAGLNNEELTTISNLKFLDSTTTSTEEWLEGFIIDRLKSLIKERTK